MKATEKYLGNLKKTKKIEIIDELKADTRDLLIFNPADLRYIIIHPYIKDHWDYILKEKKETEDLKSYVNSCKNTKPYITLEEKDFRDLLNFNLYTKKVKINFLQKIQKTKRSAICQEIREYHKEVFKNKENIIWTILKKRKDKRPRESLYYIYDCVSKEEYLEQEIWDISFSDDHIVLTTKYLKQQGILK